MKDDNKESVIKSLEEKISNPDTDEQTRRALEIKLKALKNNQNINK